MTFISSTRFVAKFDALPLVESVSGNVFTTIGAGTTEILDDGLGYQIKQGQHLERDDVSLQVGNEMTVGFWLKSTNPGQVRNSSTGNLEPLKISLLDIREPTVFNTLILLLYEQTDPDGQNNTLRGTFVDLFGDTFEFVSSKYSVGTWHHFWLVYNSPVNPNVQLFIDGVADSLSTTGTVPGGLKGGSAVVSINRMALSPSFNVVDSQAVIDDLVILNDADSSGATLAKVINHSLDFAFNTDYMNNEEIDQSFIFNDPDVFHLTSVETDGTNVLATRSDGKILEGSPLMWQSRKRFSDDNEINSLDTFGTGFQSVNGYLQIDGVVTVKA